MFSRLYFCKLKQNLKLNTKKTYISYLLNCLPEAYYSYLYAVCSSQDYKSKEMKRENQDDGFSVL